MNNFISKLLNFLIDEDTDMNTITEKRDKHIGGSDLPKIMTTSNLYKLALEKLNPTFQGNEYTHYGQFMEEIIRDYINEEYSYDFQPNCVYEGFYRGNCDGVDYTANKLLEIKTFGSELDIRYYMPQIQAYLYLFDVDVCLLAGYHRPHNFFTWGDITNPQSYNLEFDEDRLDIYYIPKDSRQWKMIDKRATKFYKGLVALKRNLAITINEFNTIVYGKQIVDKCESWVDHKKLEKLLIGNDIWNAQIGDVHIKRTEITNLGIDIEQFAQDMPDLYEKYKKITREQKIEIRRRKNVTKK
jgi:predicted phage-related endonuclease